MKIIFCKWGSICEKGIANALQRLGITVITMNRKFESVDYDKGYLEALADLIQKHPDASCVFSVNFQPIVARCLNYRICPGRSTAQASSSIPRRLPTPQTESSS